MTGPGAPARFTQLHLALAAATAFAASFAATRADLTRAPSLACLREATDAQDPAATLVACTDAIQRAQAAITLAAPVALAALTAFAAAVAAPALITWWFRVSPAPAVPRLGELADAAGIAHPRWLTSTRRHRDAFTYHRGVVLIPKVTRALRRRDPVADAIVLHELGHVANRDVGRTYRALVAPVLFLALVAVPFAVIAAERPAALEYTARFGVLVVVVLLTALAVVRAREHDADVRARGWNAGALGAALRSTTRRAPRWLSTHPASRAEAPAGGPVEGVTSGAVAAIAAVEGSAAVYHLLPTAVRLPELAAAVAGVAVGVVLTRAVRGHGLAVGGGLLLGAQLSPNAGPRLTALFHAEAEPSWPVSLATTHPTALPLLVAGAALAGLCVSAAAGRSAPRAAVLAGLPLGVWLIASRAASGDARRDAVELVALLWPAIAVAAGAAVIAVAARPAVAVAGVAVAALALARPAVPHAAPPLPSTTQSGYLCAWLASASPPTDAALAAHFARSDDPLTARIAHSLLSDPHADTALARRCDLLLRYGRI